MAKHLPSAADWAAEAEELTVKVQELSRTVADAASRIDVGEEDLGELDRRLTLVNKLLRKYHVSQVSGLVSLLESKKAKLEGLEHREERLAELNAKIAVADKAVRAAGAELTKRRTAAAKRLSKAVTDELRDLGFLQAKFFVALELIEPEAHGMDRVVYMFEPNPGEAARPLAAIASSGEIARVMLALKTAGSGERGTGNGNTLVFDEIDANIGGEVGKIVGEKM
jgi:DNA repair protein RecN (Recombination protein N)